jgi:hypothetical protein
MTCNTRHVTFGVSAAMDSPPDLRRHSCTE